MLSHQTSIPLNDNYQRQHRRQNSTPSGFEAQGTPIYTATTQQPGFHRRGMSMTQGPIAQFRPSPQDGHLVSITNTGHHPQHYLQVAQQQPQARPGPQQGTPQQQHHHLQLSEQEFRNLQHQQLDAQIDSLIRNQNNQHQHSFNTEGSRLAKIERSRSQPGVHNSTDQHVSPQPNLGPAANLPDHYGLEYGMKQHNNMGGTIIHGQYGEPIIMRPNWNSQNQRPYTPPNQNATIHPTLTPNASPHPSLDAGCGRSPQMIRTGSHDNNVNATIRPGRSPIKQPSAPTPILQAQMYHSPERQDPNATIKARHRPENLQGGSQASPTRSNQDSLPSPPNTAPLDSPEKFAFHFSSSPQSAQLALFPSEHEYYQRDGSTHGSVQASPEMSPQHRSPNMRQNMHHPEDLAAMFSIQPHSNGSSPSNTGPNSVDYGYLDSPTRHAHSPQEDMSIEDLSLDATIEDTGISAEEVQAYISQPDPESGKWTCLYPECGKAFGRKENVRAHVQTHLGDRQFKCVHCGKCFVRQHDLKRHSKTHSGVKPYPCRCGNSFARHDALTRHRQRGICTGGFEGVVKKVAKRGRPRKDRPSHDDRVDKAARTRKRAAAKSYASSVSGTSDSSFPESPPLLLSGFNFETTQAHDLAGLTPPSLTLAPGSLAYDFESSPFHSEATQSPKKAQSTTSAHSPSRSLEQGDTHIDFESMQITEHTHTTADSNRGSQVGSPPGLSHSSPPSSTRLLDFDFGSTFNSSGSGIGEDSKQNSQETDFDALIFPTSPDHAHTPWNESAFFNFEKDNGFSSGDAFGTSFDDDILFSDNCERNDPFF